MGSTWQLKCLRREISHDNKLPSPKTPIEVDYLLAKIAHHINTVLIHMLKALIAVTVSDYSESARWESSIESHAA